MRKLPDKLIEQQNIQKEQTISKVKTAIDELKKECIAISVSRISERSGLSRSVLSKPHVKEVLKQYCTETKHNSRTFEYTDKKAGQLQKSCNDKDDVIKKLQNKLACKTTECELLRGKLHILMQNCRIKGIQIPD